MRAPVSKRSGKTTLLLDLTADLLVRAGHDETQPIPVVIPLASWGVKRQALEEWLTEELFIKYEVPHALGRKWIAEEQILPLLDGLDEIAPEHRTACIEAINAYRPAHNFIPLVVTCRSAEYANLGQRLRLDNAVVVQPLTDQQIEQYLAKTSDAFASVRQVLEEDTILRKLASTPLMLSVLAVTYADRPMDRLLAIEVDRETRRKQIFATYVYQMTHRCHGAKKCYSYEQTVSWLAWLAQQMTGHLQTEF